MQLSENKHSILNKIMTRILKSIKRTNGLFEAELFF